MNEAIDKNLDGYLADHPYIQETASIHLKIDELLEEFYPAPAMPDDASLKDYQNDKLPVLQHDDVCKRVAEAAGAKFFEFLDKLSKQKLPKPMRDSARELEKYTNDAARCSQLFKTVIWQQQAVLDKITNEHSLNKIFVKIICWKVIGKLIPQELKAYTVWGDADENARNYCPVCGRRPVMAHLRKEANGKARYLTCDGCHTEWRFHRIGCPYCGNDDLENIKILVAAEEPNIRLDVCHKCRTYLKTYIDEGLEDIYLQDWATLQFDLLGEEQGFNKKGSTMIDD